MRARCPCCGTTASLDVLVTHEDARAALAAAFGVSMPLGSALVRYLALFRPATRELTMARVATLLGEVQPYLSAGCIPRKGRDWPAAPADWVQAIELTLLARDAGKLTLPLTGHGYLLEVLASLGDKSERLADQTQEAQRRQAGTERLDADPVRGQITVRGQAMSIGQGLAQVYGGRDPELAKLDADRGQAAPMPAAVKEQAQALRRESHLVRQMKTQLKPRESNA